MKNKIISIVVMAIVIIAFIVGDVIAAQWADTITLMFGGSGDEESEELTVATAASDELCKEIEEEGIVLLKNDTVSNAPILPLKADERKINVFGYGATDDGFLLKGVGSGSSSIDDKKKKTFLMALEQTGFEYNTDIISYDGTEVGRKLNGGPYVGLSGVRGATTSQSQQGFVLNEPELSSFNMTSYKSFSDVALFVVSRVGGENMGGELPETYLDLTEKESTMIKTLSETFGKVIVILNTTNTMHAGFLDDYSNVACISVGLPGQSGAIAVANILKGEKEVTKDDGTTEIQKISPSGKLADIMTYNNTWDPTFVNHVVTNSSMQYQEDIYYGYKWYETADKDGFFTANNTKYEEVVQYPFGYGLSYTKFEWEIQSINKVKKDDDGKVTETVKFSQDNKLEKDTEIEIKVKVTNTGDYPGQDVVELYYTPEYFSGEIEKAEINLLDFAKTTKKLAPGDNEIVTLSFTAYELASYDCYDKNHNGSATYEIDAGKYAFKFMTDSHTLATSKLVTTDVEYAEATYTLNAANDIIFDTDPVTGNEIANRFTSENAYAGVPIDGSTAGLDGYMTRANFVMPSKAKTPNSTEVSKAANYLNPAYDSVASMPTFGAENGLYLMTENGAKPSATSLSKGSDALEWNMDLVEELYKNPDSDKWDQLLDQMTVNELTDLIELGGFKRREVASIGLRRMADLDGPAGFNNGGGAALGDTSIWTAFTSEALMGQTWNKTLMFSLGRSMGAEANGSNTNGWYAPGVNLHRNAYTARNFEYYSEDGVLSGKLAVQVIAGAKTQGLSCYLKHFTVSEPGPNPGGVNTWLTEQNLRENYLKPFEIAAKGIDVTAKVKDSDEYKTVHLSGNAIMTAFNRVGASWAGASYGQNVEILRNEWGFKGMIITDWTNGAGIGGMNSRQGVRAGNDLWLNPSNGGKQLQTNDAVDMYCARQSAKNIIYATLDSLYTNHVTVSDIELDGITVQSGTGFKAAVFPWWIPVLACIEIVVVGGLAAWVVLAWLPEKKKNV